MITQKFRHSYVEDDGDDGDHDASSHDYCNCNDNHRYLVGEKAWAWRGWGVPRREHRGDDDVLRLDVYGPGNKTPD